MAMEPRTSIDVGVFLAGLLYQYDSVVLPGLGCFVTRYKPAEIDRVQGKLFPPSKKLVFEEQPTPDDGRLAARVRDRHGLSQEEAQRTVNHFVHTIKEAVRQREIVVFPEVGRLYEDYQHNLQFIPDSTNFNPSTYGLPAINYTVTTGKTLIQRADPPVRREAVAPTLENRFVAAVKRNLSVVVAVAILILALSIYLLLPKTDDFPIQETLERVIPPDRLNRSPIEEELPGEEEAASAPGLDDALDSEASTLAPDQSTAWIAIGLFRDQPNIDRLVREIYAAGYEPYIDPRNDATLVGVQLAYDEEPELQLALENIRETFAADAFILRREQ